MYKKTFTTFLELKPVLQGKHIYIMSNGIEIQTSYTCMKHSLDFDTFTYTLEYNIEEDKMKIYNVYIANIANFDASPSKKLEL